jgi:peptidoglycan/LPS O-acetylase OafA/YrhL
LTDVSYRADIDGLRALAVLSVVAFHANPSLLHGGFVGVDVFFVISGFLISGLILDDLQNGSFSFLEFYARRVRRLFPALITVLLTVWGIGWFVMLPPEFAALGDYMLAGVSFVANILTFSQIDYFDAPAATKPLLHLWSLGVEEQFYVVFPAVIVLAWRAGKVRSALLVLGALSFLANIILTHRYPSFSFYLPVTRFWEFVAGALLADHAAQQRRLDRPISREPPSRLREMCSVAGLLLIAKGFISITSQSFPGWWALLPVVGTVLIIGAGPQTWINRKVMADPRLRAIGLFSYPLYLWHWPLLVIGRSYVDYVGEDRLHAYTTTISAIGLAFVLSWLTYQFIERPVRARRPLIAMRRVAVASFACAASVAILGFATAQSIGFLTRYPSDVQALLTPLVYGVDFPVEDESKNQSRPLVVPYGDSHARHLLAGLRYLQSDRTFRIEQIGWRECAPVGLPWGVARTSSVEEGCPALAAENEKRFEELKPDIVVLGAFWRQYDHLERLGDTISNLHRLGIRRVVVMGDVPFWPRPPQALMYEAYQADPRRRVPDRLFGFDKKTLEVDQHVRQIASDSGAVFISPFDTLCNESGCLTRLGDHAKDIVQIDLTHFSAVGSRFLIEHVADQIFGTEPPKAVDISNLKVFAPPKIQSIEPVSSLPN